MNYTNFFFFTKHQIFPAERSRSTNTKHLALYHANNKDH